MNSLFRGFLSPADFEFYHRWQIIAKTRTEQEYSPMDNLMVMITSQFSAKVILNKL